MASKKKRYDYRKPKAYLARKQDAVESWKANNGVYVEKKKVRVPIDKQYIFTREEAGGRKNIVFRNCPTCNKEIGTYKSRTTKTGRTWCSKKCYKDKDPITKYVKRMANISTSRSMVKKVINRKGFYKSNKDAYKNKIIDFPDSPTGKAYIGINKEPLMRAADGGHGFQGVVLQDEDREYIQCHSCGKWAQKITSSHIKKCCDLSVIEYKKKYGIYKNTGLVSDETSLRLTQACLKNKQHNHSYEVNFKGKNGARAVPDNTGSKHAMEFHNRYGTCPLQLKIRLCEFINCNRELPAQGNRGRTIYKALVSRYGSWGHALQSNGLPYFKRTGTNMMYMFPDGTHYKYNINQFHDRELLYTMLKDKCPVLSQ